MGEEHCVVASALDGSVAYIFRFPQPNDMWEFIFKLSASIKLKSLHANNLCVSIVPFSDHGQIVEAMTGAFDEIIIDAIVVDGDPVVPVEDAAPVN